MIMERESMEQTITPLSEEDVTGIEEKLEGTVAKVSKRGRKPINNEQSPFSLRQISGEQAIDLLEFLHKKYLSWIREAEASKYVDIVKSIREATLEEAKTIYSSLVEEYEKRLEQRDQVLMNVVDKLEKMTQTIEKLTQQPPQQQQPQQTIIQFLNDPRVRTLIFLGLEKTYLITFTWFS